MTDEELKVAIAMGRRVTRDAGILAVFDELEWRLNQKPDRRRGLKGGPGPPSKDDRRVKKALYMRRYMVTYRAKKKAEKIGTEGMVDRRS